MSSFSSGILFAAIIILGFILIQTILYIVKQGSARIKMISACLGVLGGFTIILITNKIIFLIGFAIFSILFVPAMVDSFFINKRYKLCYDHAHKLGKNKIRDRTMKDEDNLLRIDFSSLKTKM